MNQNKILAARVAEQKTRDDAMVYRVWEAGRIVPWRITQALDSRGLYGPEVDEACGAQEPDVDMWEDGTRYPTWAQVNALCELTGMTLKYFTMRDFENITGVSSLQFHIPKAYLPEFNKPPILTFTPEAIAATLAAR